MSSLHTCAQGEKDKVRTFRKEGNFVGYSEFSKAYKIYIPGSRQIEVNRDVTFEEEMALKKGKGLDMEINDEEMIGS